MLFVNKKNHLRLLVILITMLGITACGDSDYNDLEQKINAFKEKKPETVAPLPKFLKIQSYNYSVDSQRSPFSPLLPRKGDMPNAKRPKEALEAFSLDSLRMVGTLFENNKRWAIIAAPDGMIYNVTVGNYMGQNYGRIVKVNDNRLELIETIQGADGWVERPTSFILNESE